MFRGALWPLRQRRYRALATFMALIALVCVAIGTFEIHRLQEKRHANGALRANAYAAVTSLSTALVPLAASGSSSGSDGSAVRYRSVRASGTYLAGNEQYLDDQSQGGRQGFLVLTPLRTAAGTLLVGRGFIAATSSGKRPASVAPPPTGAVEVTGWLRPGQSSDDRLGRLGYGEITAINPAQQSRRLAQPVFDGYLTLRAGQPGTAGLAAVPRPSLSNPSGGAGELQLLSYVVQWYAFALLALLAPFLFARAEVREAQRRFLGIDAGAQELELTSGAAVRPALAAGSQSTSTPGAAVEVRSGAVVAERASVDQQRVQRAVRIADRYGRSLGPAVPDPPVAKVAPAAADQDAPASALRRRRVGGVPDGPAAPTPTAPHRSPDGYHGSYNDYLWQLALADGELSELLPAPDAAPTEPRPRVLPPVIDVKPVSDDEQQ